MYINKLVSIVLLCYKNAEFIDEAIESILNQTYQNFEVIIADDASNDGSEEIISKWVKKDNRIIPLIQPVNIGMSGNQNAGFNKVRGEFIVPMSGDDILLPNKLEKQVIYLQEHPECGLVLSKTQAFDSDTKEILWEMTPCQSPEEWFFRTDWFFAFPQWYGSHNNTTTMGRSSYYLQCRYDTRLKYKGEVLHAMENYAKSPNVKWHGMNEVLSKYRIHNQSATHTNSLTDLINEESWIIHGIINVRYPQLHRKAKNSLQFRLFNQYIFDHKQKNSLNCLYRELGIYKFIYALLIKGLTRLNLRGIISKPARYLRTKQLYKKYEHIR
ncbi:glycosyltransferase family 2 protein [Carboxylicivirga sp. RSCT41]|uniref:glycosyltransferase family 2 protein n=1 Tax=Carboxylicivirga agarovorans TaxID=3417570 RepID=UPI003D337873